MTSQTKPFVGQKCTFYPSTGFSPAERVRGEVVKVWSDTCVNLQLVDGQAPTSVLVFTVGPDSGKPPAGYYCVLDSVETMVQPRISGYSQLTPADAALMNAIKAKGDELRALVDQVNAHLQEQGASIAAGNAELQARHRTAEPQRWLAMARTDLQTGVMRLVRAVAQPGGF